MAGVRDPLEPVMCPVLGEEPQAKPRLAGETTSWPVSRAALAKDCRSSRPPLATLTMVMGTAKEAAAIMTVACRLLKGPSEASSWTGSWRGFGAPPLGSK